MLSNESCHYYKLNLCFLKKKAHDELVRRELGVDGLAIIRTADYERCLFISTVLNPKVSEKENLYSPQQESQ